MKEPDTYSTKNNHPKLVFPILCHTDGCGKEYGLAGFIDVILLWGFICLSNRQNTYIGFTCPNCLHTAIDRHPISNPASLIEYLEERGIDIQKRYRGIRPYLRNYVPFSVSDIEKRLGKESDALKELMLDGEIYTLPDVAHPIIDYPWTKPSQNAFRIGEKAIPELANIENRFRVKVFPRIVGFSSIYKKTDRLLLEDQNVVNTLKNLIETHYGEKRSYELDAEYYRDVYTDMIKDDLTMADYDAIFTSKSYSSTNKINLSNDIVYDYRKIRSNLDFELVYRNEFVNEVARSLFIEEKPEEPIKEKPTPDDKGARENIRVIREAQEEILEKLSNLEQRFCDLEKIVTQNHQVMELKCKVAEAAEFDTDILIIGESGTGKELFVRAIHQASERKGDLVPINCGSIPKDLFESELFGHKKGAFTGAISDKIGAFEYANQGTLFLDELGEMPIELQAKLLRVVEYREIKPVGSEKLIHVDVKLVFATNRDLKKEVDSGNFRNDLFFRINSPSFYIPPLRERVEDIPLLADHFRILFSKKFNKQAKAISPDLINKLKGHNWLGNVRELMKVMEMAVMNSGGALITESDLPDSFDKEEVEDRINGKEDLPPATKITNEEIIYWMNKLDNNKSKVAERLGVTYRTILRRCNKLNL